MISAKARDQNQLLLPIDTLLRLSAVLGIHKNFRILFSRPQDEAAWLKSPHDAPVFGGQPPLDLLTSGTQDGLMLVRRYLDAWRGGVFAAPNAADRNFTPYSDEDIVIDARVATLEEVAKACHTIAKLKEVRALCGPDRELRCRNK
jgi:hypothetical protein